MPGLLLGHFLIDCVAQDPNWGPEPPVAPYGTNPLPSERVVLPLTFPVLGTPRWQDGYGEMRKGFLHTGIDIRAPKMTPIVAPFSGTLGMKRYSFWIYGDNGWLTLGTHLNDDTPGTNDNRGERDTMFAPDISPGCHVYEGQFLGYVGDSGDATAPHLHFEIYAPGEGATAGRIRNPFPSLLKARVIKEPVVRFRQFHPLPAPDMLRLQGCVRKVDPAKRFVTIQLTAKLLHSGEASPVTVPRYVRLTAYEPEILSSLQRVAPTQSVGFYVSAKGPLGDQRIVRILL